MRLTICLTCAAVLAGCSRPGFEGFFSSGERYLAAKKFSDAAIEFQNAARVNPESALAQIKLGDAYLALSQTSAAAAAYQRACTLAPDNVDACVQAAARFLAMGDFEPAVINARTALAADRFSLDAQLILGSALAGVRRFAESEERLEAALAQAPSDPRPYKALGEMQLRRGNVKAAEVWLQKAIERAPSSPSSVEARVELARVMLDTGRGAEGEKELRAAVAADPTDAEANEMLATYLVATDRCDDSEQYWKALAAQTTDGSGTLALADFYVSRGRSDEALKVLGQSSQDPAAGTRMASIMYDRGDRPKAAALVDQLLERQQTNVQALLLKARMALDDSDLAKAREFAHRAAAIQPDAAAVRNMLAATNAATK